MDSHFFEAWFKVMFLNEIEENKIIVMDNASFHRKKVLHELCKHANKNLNLIFLPPYSPELNPIGIYWYILKRKLKKMKEYSWIKFTYYSKYDYYINFQESAMLNKSVEKDFLYRFYRTKRFLK